MTHHTATERARRTTRARAITLALSGCAALLVASCAASADPDTTTGTSTADWCWRHYTFAPAGALISDLGPPTVDAAEEWLTWLHATVDAPTDRRPAQSEQLHLVDRLRTSGRWTSADRARYRRSSTSDPTPATLCETTGARIIPHPDGSLSDGWMDRFLDPDDPAFSRAARTESEAAQ